MTGTPYARGNHFERRVKADLEDRDFICFQTRGSKTAADIIAVNRHAIMLVQVKSGATQVNHSQWNALIDLAFKADAEPVIADRADRPRGGIRYRRIVGYHQFKSRDWPAEEWTP